jgi:hypothetical protein
MSPTKPKSGTPNAGAIEGTASKQVVLRRIEDTTVIVPIIGITPVIPHKWSEKAIGMMEAKQFGLPQSKREAKNPEDDAEASMYRLAAAPEDAGRYPYGYPGMPATAFKAAMVSACRFFEGLPMTSGRLLIFVQGEGPDQLVRLTGVEQMRRDLPRNATGVVDLRFRTQLLAGVDGVEPWRAVLPVTFPASLITADSILALVDAAGRNGVGDWRPGSPKSNTGVFGTFRVDDDRMAQMAAGDLAERS